MCLENISSEIWFNNNYTTFNKKITCFDCLTNALRILFNILQFLFDALDQLNEWKSIISFSQKKKSFYSFYMIKYVLILHKIETF